MEDGRAAGLFLIYYLLLPGIQVAEAAQMANAVNNPISPHKNENARIFFMNIQALKK